MGIFDINFQRKIKHSLPVRLRKKRHLAWLLTTAAPVIYLYGLFIANREKNNYKLTHNGQVCKLEAVLNDAFDPIDRGIYISDPDYIDPVYTFLDSEESPVYIDLDAEIGTAVIDDPDPAPLYTEAEILVLATCFIVNVPVAVVYDEDRMRALIDDYRLVGRRNYTIVTF